MILLENCTKTIDYNRSVVCSSHDLFLIVLVFTFSISTYLPKVLNSRLHICVDRHSHSLDDVSLFPPQAPLGGKLLPDSSHSYTFGIPDISTNTKTPLDHSYYVPLQCQAKPSFYGRRSANSLSLDTLGDEQFLEFIL